ncbi:hypothetical protein K435DRAFT_727758 [Dendrothele bispora CBS 962.96]|uniref:Uncharacterized protein n=1 Tax=Dendrothele bispora (strain CBS 962.96) TaxID=1314807 RepID=A0A4S8LNK5_DENBC|nr:hypothetical protein K435DRAFT_727758 [Dendrothele bispora CBS 962.96]
MRKYVEALRKERTGREIHHKRFFLKVDDGHKIRMKVLTKLMATTVEALNGLHNRAFELYMATNPNYEWCNQDNLPDMSEVRSITNLQEMLDRLWTEKTEKHTKESVGDDLVEMKARRAMLSELDNLLNPFDYKDTKTSKDPLAQSSIQRERNISRILVHQFARRIIFYDPILCSKAIDKVSFEDLFSHPDFTLDDLFRFMYLYENRLGLGLLWFKDSTMEACAMAPSLDGKDEKNAANVGDYESRVSFLGGWIYNRRHKMTMTNEGWSVPLPANIENRFVRLCNNFDDLCGFLSFTAFGMMKSPSWCPPNCQVYRNHLSLSGVVVADMISSPMPEFMQGPIPTRRPAKRPGMINYAEVEIRSFLFGAIRNESDSFTDAFLQELRARPDLFCVTTRSDTDRRRKVETFGGLEGTPLPHTRGRNFDARPGRVPVKRRGWDLEHSAFDILYCTGNGNVPAPEGYLVREKKAGSFFHFKRFPVKYFIIIDVHPGRDVCHLAREVAWAALRAQGLAEGEFKIRKYARASDQLFRKCSSERFSWMPSSRWQSSSMEIWLPFGLEPEDLIIFCQKWRIPSGVLDIVITFPYLFFGFCLTLLLSVLYLCL